MIDKKKMEAGCGGVGMWVLETLVRKFVFFSRFAFGYGSHLSVVCLAGTIL